MTLDKRVSCRRDLVNKREVDKYHASQNQFIIKSYFKSQGAPKKDHPMVIEQSNSSEGEKPLTYIEKLRNKI
jgi:hypothetical protein